MNPREHMAAALDFLQQKLTCEYARAEYGGVINANGELDLAATEALRAELAAD